MSVIDPDTRDVFAEEIDKLRAELEEVKARLEASRSDVDHYRVKAQWIEADVERLRAKNDRLQKALKLIEWGGAQGAEWCGCCKSHQSSGHDRDCPIAALLSERADADERAKR